MVTLSTQKPTGEMVCWGVLKKQIKNAFSLATECVLPLSTQMPTGEMMCGFLLIFLYRMCSLAVHAKAYWGNGVLGGLLLQMRSLAIECVLLLSTKRA